MAIVLIATSTLLLAATLATAQQTCGSSDWHQAPHNGKCYKVFNEQIGWSAGEFKCVASGGHQASVNDHHDNQFVADLAKQAGQVWLGAAQFGGSPNYEWSDRSPFVFENWMNGARPSYHPGKKCITIDGASGKWIQSCCKVPSALICQKGGSGFKGLPGKITEDGSGMPGRDFRHKRFVRFERNVQ